MKKLLAMLLTLSLLLWAVPALAEGDTVITAVGMEANHALFDAIRDDYETVLALGDGRRVRNIFGAIWDGYEAARSL